MQARGDSRQVLFFQRFARKDEPERGVIVDNDAPIAIQNFSTRRRQRKRFDAVPLSRFVIKALVLHLQLPEARGKKYKNGYDAILNKRDFAGREFRIVP